MVDTSSFTFVPNVTLSPTTSSPTACAVLNKVSEFPALAFTANEIEGCTTGGVKRAWKDQSYYDKPDLYVAWEGEIAGQ